MTIREQISALESRQLELRAIMADSDAHASKCQKLGLVFSEKYPDELAAYEAANTEWHANDVELAELYEKLREEEEKEREHHDDENIEGE